MPELPEVETTVRGIEPCLIGRSVSRLIVRNASLRWPVPREVKQANGRRIVRCWRRAKYILIDLGGGGLLIHLGMSGSLRVCDAGDAPRKHDHFDLVLDNEKCIRFNDPRRFGVLTWWQHPAEEHKLLRQLGPEPLSEAFSGRHLWHRSRGRKAAVKNFIMDGKVVVGVGNIYASEALYMSGIHPSRQAGRVSAARYDALAGSIQDVLSRAIRRGGTTLRDFVNSNGQPGYFAQELLVYERAGHSCFQCRAPIRRKVIGQRSSYYCPHCQR
ncbi:MAG: bifunctional DNA-formamidopyrimidine glycosylase/DNA-(apurinic or apyrimidinic site) lyase [Xanthomonadales bacterium]|nr:bifunctional DNA-formamidopyrimidine glycosylase/DNA-(apurinic or apyrimidinic site) lyase [Gammaproteobacteria bacterium]MBT8053539.1 bifunctional DNA-formamidopyrimidine glycosylase/DNA-(apurinic or apyrimidinic site) lyase [Gammaproteobacteria bacterium]NND57980.1 bifunctional DNA-formamidopyrimidine glycosylase/DNA-(apurinic or apyrimidinic site) lyase [Xanthomonadales bacterium]NNK50854.1 bifunctional DNA-formamidopyrimidine glycosylase/DNA-(apurinic or apyrimidinic site) lyase [Xanthomo